MYYYILYYYKRRWWLITSAPFLLTRGQFVDAILISVYSVKNTKVCINSIKSNDSFFKTFTLRVFSPHGSHFPKTQTFFLFIFVQININFPSDFPGVTMSQQLLQPALLSPRVNFKLSLVLDDEAARNPSRRAEKLPDLPFFSVSLLLLLLLLCRSGPVVLELWFWPTGCVLAG